ncbi:MAG: DUF899 domain-containing protein [Propionibacteriales bacterium]|nr:DUF899 domain-containing protein [Propionibacteriales bacterium]
MDHKVVDRNVWNAARAALLTYEKEQTRREDELARRRRELPWVEIEKEYVFDSEGGRRTLAELLGDHSQLVLYHLQFGPTYDAACPVNSSIGDCLNAVFPHLGAHDVSLALVSRAPIEKLTAYRRRMGWDIPWVSAGNTDFSTDLGAASTEEQMEEFLSGPGVLDSLPPIVQQNVDATGTTVAAYLAESPVLNVFALREGTVYLTYTTTARGLECVMNYYDVLDRVPGGRNEGEAFQTWIRRRDEYA